MDRNRELRIYMKAARANCDDGNGRHLSHDELIAYWQNDLTEPEREAAQTHLLRCDQCLALFRDVNDFFEPRRDDETEMNEFEAHRAWRDLRRRLPDAAAIAAPTAQSSTGWPRFKLRLAPGIAAGLLIAVALVGLWALRLRQENQNLVVQTQTLQRELQARLAQIDNAGQQQTEEARKLSERLDSLERQLAALNQPQTSISEHELLLVSEARGDNSPYEVNVPPSARSYVLKIMLDKPEEFTSYVVEIVDRQNRTMWKSERLNPGPDGSLIIGFQRAFLSEGKYRLRLFGWKGNTTRRAGESDLTLKFLR
jgi:hypothetical protein